METLLGKLFEIFSLEYMFTVIMCSYFVIKIIDVINKDKAVPTWMKRVVTFIVGVVGIIIFKMYTDVGVQTLLASFFAAVFVYDTAIKTIIRKFNIDYKK